MFLRVYDSVQLLFLIDNLRPGGAQKALLAIVKATKDTAAEPVVWCLGGSSRVEIDFEALGVRILGRPQRRVDFIAEPLALLNYLHREDVALIQTFLFHSDILGRVLGRLARLLNRRERTPIVVSSVRATNRKNRAWQFGLQRATARLADAFTAVSPQTLKFAVAHEGVVAERASIIPNGIDLRSWHNLPDTRTARRELDLPEDAVVIGAVGRLHEQKGHACLLEAAGHVRARHPKAVFLIAGYGPLHAELESRAKQLGVAEAVRFLGYRQDVKSILAALDIFVLPSLWEGMSNAILEAMAAGKPVVATEVDGNIEQVVHGETGLLVPAANADALAGALLSLCDDPQKRKALGARGRKRVQDVFPLRRMTIATLDLYARLLEEKSGIDGQSWRIKWQTSGA